VLESKRQREREREREHEKEGGREKERGVETNDGKFLLKGYYHLWQKCQYLEACAIIGDVGSTGDNETTWL